MADDSQLIAPDPALAVVDQLTAIDYFTRPGAFDPLLARIRAEIDGFISSGWSTESAHDRVQIAAMAHKVARSKTYLESVGKGLAAELKEIPKKVDASRKHVRDTLDAWRDEVRAPLDAWEAAEDARKKHHLDRIAELNVVWAGHSTSLRDTLASISAVDTSTFEEFASEAHLAQAAAVKRMTAAIETAEKYEADQAELGALREAKQQAAAREAAAQATRDIEKRAADLAAAEVAQHEEKHRQAAERANAAAAARQADTAHRARINTAAARALLAMPAAALSEAQAQAVIVAIARELIAGVRMVY